MVCWECKTRHEGAARLCDPCKARAREEGRTHARIRRTDEAERLLMRSLRSQGLGFREVAEVVGRSVQTVYRHAGGER